MPTSTIRSAGQGIGYDHVQPDIINSESSFLTSDNILVAAYNQKIDGTLDSTSIDPYDTTKYIPIGVLENIGVAQQKVIQQLWEIGSKKSYLVPGRTTIQVTLNRVLLDGDSLLRVLYPTAEGEGTALNMADYNDFVMTANNGTEMPGTFGGHPSKPDLWFNLASQFFNKPSTLGLFFYSSNHELEGQIILHDCLAEAINFGISAGQAVVTENVRLRVTEILSVSPAQSSVLNTAQGALS